MPAHSKPTTPHHLNYRDPLRRNLVQRWLLHEGEGTFSHGPDTAELRGSATWATKADWSTGGGANGPGVHCDATSLDRLYLGDVLPGGTPTEGASLGVVLDFEDTATQGTLVWSSHDETTGTESIFLIHRTGGQLWFLDDYGNSKLSAAGALPNGCHTLLITRYIGTVEVYVDGTRVIQTNSATAGPGAVGYTVLGCRQHATVPAQNTRFLAAASWKGRLLREDVQRWAADPYSLWRYNNTAVPYPQKRLGFFRNVSP